MIEVVADIVGDVGDASSLPAAPERNMTAPVEPWYSCSTVRFCECISTAHRSRAAAGERAPPRARGRCMRRERTCVLVGLQALRRGWPPPDALAHGPRPTRYCRQAAPPHQAQAASWQAQLSCHWACEPLHEIHWASRTGFLPANTNNFGFLLVAAIGRVGRVGLVGDSLRSSVAPGGRQRQQLWPTAWCGRPLCARAGVQCHPEKRGLCCAAYCSTRDLRQEWWRGCMERDRPVLLNASHRSIRAPRAVSPGPVACVPPFAHLKRARMLAFAFAEGEVRGDHEPALGHHAPARPLL